MPTERFYRLPEAKKKLIREAAIREFARVPYEKASINQIIHNADISRGSFYTYFEDKQDVVRFIFEDSCEQMKELCQRELQTNGGDYFGMLLALFDYFVEKLQQTREMFEMVRNVFSYQENATLMGFDGFPKPAMGDNKKDTPVAWIYGRIDRSRFSYGSAEEFLPLLTLGMAATMYSFKQYYEYPDCLEAVRANFLNSLELLKYGAYRR